MTTRPTGRPLAAPDLKHDRGRIGAAIRQARLDSGRSVVEISRRLRIPRWTWYSYERGVRLPPLTLARRICGVLGCELDAIIPEGD